MVDSQRTDQWRTVDWLRIDRVFDVSTGSLPALAEAAGHDPKLFFRGRNFGGLNLSGVDVRGIDFTKADLRGTKISEAIIDNTTILQRARIDTVDRAALRKQGFANPSSRSSQITRIPSRRYPASISKYISVFISHSSRDNEEVQYYETVLNDAGLSTFQTGGALRPGDLIRSSISERINSSHFFLLIVSDNSLASEWVQRELGLATARRRQNGGYRPIILPIYAKNGSWREKDRRPTAFPTRNFDTGKKRKPFDLMSARGLDRYATALDSADAVISLMRPRLLVSRLDFQDETTFHQTQVFRLYEDVFPAIERDDSEDIIQWVLRRDIGKKRRVILSNGTIFTYNLDSRYFILSMANVAIGLAFLTYDHTSRFLYANYIAIQRCWRAGAMANAFLAKIMDIQGKLFPKHRGMLLEIDIFDKERIERIIDYLEVHRTFESTSDKNEIRKFLKVRWYQALGYLFFIDERTREPLVCTAPCINPEEPQAKWQSLEKNYWIVWNGRPTNPPDRANAKELCAKAVTCIYVEILTKSLVESYPKKGLDYWRYANTVVNRTLKGMRAKEITFGTLLDRRDSTLIRRWVNLGIDLPL